MNSIPKYTGWALVYDGTSLRLKSFLNDQTLSTPYTIELFDTEEEIDDRIIELGLE